jgi:hypothetical protein
MPSSSRLIRWARLVGVLVVQFLVGFEDILISSK